MRKYDPFSKSVAWGKILASRVCALLLSASLLFTLALPVASASTNPLTSDSPTDSFARLAATCSSDTLTHANIAGGDMLYDSLYSARKEDRPRLNKICDIIKRFAADGKPATPFDPTPETFFHGLELSFVQDNYASVFLSDALYLQSKDLFLKLTDSKAIQEYNSFLKRTEFLTIAPEKPRFGEQVHLKGHQPLFFSDPVYVFWTPESESYTSSPSTSSLTPSYPADSSLLLYEGKQQFGYYDLSFLLPALGKAADGSMKPLGSKGSLIVRSGPGQGGNNHSEGLLELLPSNKPFLSVNGVPSKSEDLRPLLREGRALLPLRSAAKLAGQSVTWDSSTWSVLIRSNPPKKSDSSYLQPQLWIDGKLASKELQPILLGGVTYVPIRALTVAFGIPVAWDNISRSVLIDL